MRNRFVAVAVVAAVACLGAASCSTHVRATGHLAAVGSPAVSASPAPTGSPSGSPTTGAGGSPTQHGGGGPGGGSTATTKPGAPKVTGTIDALADYSGTNCPYSTVATGTVSVDHGPISLKVGWDPNYVVLLVPVEQLNFPGRGPQSAKVSFTLQPPPDDTNVTVTLQIDGATQTVPLATAGFTMTCKAQVSRPTASQTSGSCPYLAVWTGTITMSYADPNVTYEWDASNIGKIGGGTLDFTQPGSKMVSSPDVKVLTHAVGTDFVVTLKVTSPAGGSNGSAARCTSIRSP
ncbi:MAG TPA: hypothetical protein VH442_04740 [Micromonosporaceae bacterium]|jgi:hypothetical protein